MQDGDHRHAGRRPLLFFARMEFSRHDIATFLAVARCGNVSRAAVEVGMSQPSVSKAIRRLEQETGVPLFERSGHGVRLTGEGLVFLETARRFDAQHFELVRTASELRARHAGVLRVGITSPAPDGIAVRAIAELVRRRPGMRLHLTIDRSDTLAAAIEDAQLDLAVVPAYPGQALDCAQIALSEDAAQVVVRAGHPLTQRPQPTIADLAPYRWVLPLARSAARRHMTQIFERAGVPAPQVSVEAEYTSEAVMGIVQATDLLALAPSSVLRSWRGRVQPLALPELEVRRTLVLLSHPQARWTHLMTAFRDLVMDLRPATPQP